MRKGIAHLLSICLLTVMSSVAGVGHETGTPVQESPAAAQTKPTDAEQESRAATKATTEQRRAVTKAAAEQRRAVRKAAAEQRHAATKAALKEKRALAHEKQVLKREKHVLNEEKRRKMLTTRAAAHAVAEQRRAVQRAIRETTRRPEGTFRFLGPRLGAGKVVKGAPYSATAITEHKRTLGDGNQIIQKNEAIYYRDSEGRTRIEQTLKTLGKWTTSGEPARVITIFDPVAGTYHSLDPRTKTALMDAGVSQRISKPKPDPKPNPKPMPSDGADSMSLTGPKDLKEPKKATALAASKRPESAERGAKESNSREKTRQSLGTRVIEGVSAEGTRQTVTIPAGEIGNVSPIEIVDENWYSPELQVPVMTSHRDPRSGDTIYRLTNINRSEPSRSLFEVPADYRIVDRRARKSTSKPTIGPQPPKVAEPAKIPEVRL